jgi:exodeoxyribonuclease VII small subunit
MADRTHPSDTSDTTDGAVGYGEALAELEAILDEIEDDAVDVDVLAARVTRAAELLRVCRDRITAARVEVEQIVADLDPGATGPAPADRDDAGDGA